MADANDQSTLDKLNQGAQSAERLIETFIPTVGAIGTLVRLIASEFRPTDAQKAQEFDAAIAELDASRTNLHAALDDYQRIRAARVAAGGDAGTSPAGGGSA